MSFRRRLTLALFLFGGVFLLFPSLLFYHQVKTTLSQNLDDALKSVARAELASTFDDPDEKPHVHESTSPLLVALDTKHKEVSWITGVDGAVIAKTEALAESTILDVTKSLPPPSQEGTLHTHSINGESYRLLTTELVHRGEKFIEVVGLSRAPLLERLATLRNEVLSATVVWFFLLILAARKLSWSLTRPLSRLAEQLEALGPGSTSLLPDPSEPQDKELKVLYQSVNTMLNRVDEVLTSQKHFVSDTSHEIRAPLTNLKVALEVCLRKDRDSAEYREVLEVCQVEVTRLVKLAERLLTLSRLDSREFRLELSEVDFSLLVSRAVELLKGRLLQSNLTLDLQLEEKLLIVCDEGATRQVVDNLLDNAVRYAPRDTTVRINGQRLDEVLRFSVSNRGNSISEEQKERVFHRFFRGDASRHRETGGAGLGLSIVKGFVEAHGGKVGANFGEADEVTFWFELPLHAQVSPIS